MLALIIILGIATLVAGPIGFFGTLIVLMILAKD